MKNENAKLIFFYIAPTKIYISAIIVQTNKRLFRCLKSMVLSFVYFCRVK
jgi:hypothetical protein